MTRKVFLVLLAVVLALSVGLVACGGAGEQQEEEEEEEWVGEQEEEEEEEEIETWQSDVHGEVTFSQVEWMQSPREVLYPYSNVGTVEFAFLEGAGDWLLAEHGGGWLNVVLVSQSGVYEWVVQNLYLTYKNMDYLLASQPSVQFSLGLDNETRIHELEAAVFLSDEPLEAQPDTEELLPYTVGLVSYLTGGGWYEGLADLLDFPFIVTDFVGSVLEPVRTASISIPIGDWAEVEEGKNGCVPGSVARCISYLRIVNGWAYVDTQDIYQDLYTSMGTTSANGTTGDGCAHGKEEYSSGQPFTVSRHVMRTVTTDPQAGLNFDVLISFVQDHLDAGCGAEMCMIGQYSHIVMVTSVTEHKGGYYTIRYVNDSMQGKLGGNRTEEVICVNSVGEFGSGRRVADFTVECLTEP